MNKISEKLLEMYGNLKIEMIVNLKSHKHRFLNSVQTWKLTWNFNQQPMRMKTYNTSKINSKKPCQKLTRTFLHPSLRVTFQKRGSRQQSLKQGLCQIV